MTEETTVPAILWDEVEVLRPGMDFKEGMIYVTVPARIQVLKQKGSGKRATEEIVPMWGLACIRSDHKQFRFIPEDVNELGFEFPQHVTVPDRTRWSYKSITDYVTGKTKAPHAPTLYNNIRKVYEDYIEFSSEEYYDVMTLFIFSSYVFRMFKSTGYVHFNGTAASGKSQNLRILEALAFNTSWASSMTAAAMYRTLAGNPGVMCIDEAEGWEGERGEELRRILNAGYLDGSTVKRAEKGANDTFVVQSFDSYGPKAIASINPLDAVIGSRCLIVGMRPAVRTIREFDKDDEQWQRLRDRLYLWLMEDGHAISELVEQWNEATRFERTPLLVSRQWQITQMYIVLADYFDQRDGGHRVDTLYRFFSEYFERLQRQQDAVDRIRLLLRTLPEVLRTKTAFDDGWYHIKTIHEVVSAYIEDDAKEYYKTRSVSKHLDVLGFKKRRPHKQGQQVWLDPDQIRNEFKQRRVEPAEDDVAWLNGEIEYDRQHEVIAREPSDSVWAGLAEEEDA